MPAKSPEISAAVSRRLVLTAGAALAASAALPRLAFAQNAADVTAIILSDLHSPYRRLAQLVAAVRNRAAEASGKVIIIVNGDMFERGNAVALRSRVAADLVALERLAQIAPVYFNIGNHETAVLEDMAIFTREADARGVQVMSNIVDARTGRLLAPAARSFGVIDKRVALAGLGTDNIFTYRPPIRPTLTIPQPVAWAESLMPGLTRDADAAIIVSHAGVAADKAMLDMLPERSLLIGGHDHLNFTHEEPGLAYVHPGSWGNGFTVASLTFNAEGGADTKFETVAVAPDDDPDVDVANAIAIAMDEHMTDEDRATVGTVSETLDLAQSIMFATEAVREATGADVAFLGHTTFGTGLEAGDVSRYDFDAYIRFDGDIRTVDVTGEQLSAIMGRANQHTATTLDERTGDFVYARTFDLDPAATYTVAANGWTAINQQSYLGTEDLEFVEVPDIRLKQVVADALAANAG